MINEKLVNHSAQTCNKDKITTFHDIYSNSVLPKTYILGETR